MWLKGKRLISLEVCKDAGDLYSLYEFALLLPRHKFIESQVYLQRHFYTWFTLSARWTRKVDHAGLNITLGIARVEFTFDFRDGRHWNVEKNRWATEEEGKQADDDDIEEYIKR
jgi:hypothetical protein